MKVSVKTAVIPDCSTLAGDSLRHLLTSLFTDVNIYTMCLSALNFYESVGVGPVYVIHPLSHSELQPTSKDDGDQEGRQHLCWAPT